VQDPAQQSRRRKNRSHRERADGNVLGLAKGNDEAGDEGTRRCTTDETTEAPDGRRRHRLHAEERAAMKERSRELKASRGKEAGISRREEGHAGEERRGLPSQDRALATRLPRHHHRGSPTLTPKTGTGCRLRKDGKVLCFFQAADKFKARTPTFGFQRVADSTRRHCAEVLALHELKTDSRGPR